MSMIEPIHGRGSSANPGNRFELLQYEPDLDAPPEERPAPTTQFFRDSTRSLITTNDSPDVGFEASINPYRGCEHGCVYCYARPYHEYLGMSAGLDFETKILVKHDAPHILRRELASPKWRPQMLGLSGVTDCYQPIERKLQITRRCLEVLADFRNPVGIVTKNHLVTRDIDILKELARYHAALVFVSVTTLDSNLSRVMEPRASSPTGRLSAIRELADAGIPVGVMAAPIVPGLTDHEVPAIVEAAAEAGARFGGHIVVRLPHGVVDLFQNWLTQHFPEKKDKVLSRIREVRGGKLNDPRFNTRMKGEGPIADMIKLMMAKAKRQHGLIGKPKISTEHFRRPNETPATLFE